MTKMVNNYRSSNYQTSCSFPRALPLEENKELAERSSAGDLISKNKLIVHNLRLAVTIAKRYVGFGIEFEDLTYIGIEGLLKAIKRFNPKRGPFSSFASMYIKAAIIDELRQNNKHKRNLSLDATIYINNQRDNEEQTSLKSLMADDCPIDDDIIFGCELDELRIALDKLSPLSRQIVCLYYGIGNSNGERMSQPKIADALGIRQSTVSKKLTAALFSIKNTIEEIEGKNLYIYKIN